MKILVQKTVLATIGVDEFGVYEADFEVVQDSRLVQIAECCEVVLPHQDVGVPQGRQLLRLRIQAIL